jgi:gamma-glutamylcyclotransferase (GGCT)/AIG2-like uncharacterized protein YtfP
MPVYFAYGSNMDTQAMAQRCPRSKPIGTGRLARHRFALTPDGYGNVVRDPRKVVHGVLWDLALADVRALDAYEEVGRGLYRKVIQPIIKSSGGSAQALVYVAQGEGGRPRDGYMEGVLAAAQAWEFPSLYLAELAALAPNVRAGAVPQATAPLPKVRPRFATPFDRT